MYEHENETQIDIINIVWVMSTLCLLVVVSVLLYLTFSTTTTKKYVNTIIDDDQIVMENTVSNDPNDYFIMDPDGTSYYLVIDSGGKMFPRHSHYSHSITDVTADDTFMITMRNASMHNQK